jgi:uncharacterized membrane protein YeaQ/YmgE (transglycosylase-associated protein family)
MIAAWIWWVALGLVSGWLASKVRPRRGFGPMADILLGITGAIAGGCFVRFVLRPFETFEGPAFSGIRDASFKPSILFAALGAIAAIWFVRPWLKRRPKEDEHDGMATPHEETK